MDWIIRKSLWAILGFLVLTLAFMDYSREPSVALAAGTDKVSVKAKTEATEIVKSGKDLTGFIRYNKTKKNVKAQTKGMNVYVGLLAKDDKKITVNEKYALNNFIIYGTPSTSVFIADQRFLMIKKFKEFNGRLPKTAEEWQLVLKNI